MPGWCDLPGRWAWGRQIHSQEMEHGLGHEGESCNREAFSQKETKTSESKTQYSQDSINVTCRE